MKPIEDLPVEVQQIANKSQHLREQNSGRIKRLEAMGMGIEVVNARLEFFMDCMVEAGIISDEQLWAWCLTWEENLAEQLTGMENKVRDAALKAQREMRKSRLARPTAGGLLLPDGSTITPKKD